MSYLPLQIGDLHFVFVQVARPLLQQGELFLEHAGLRPQRCSQSFLAPQIEIESLPRGMHAHGRLRPVGNRRIEHGLGMPHLRAGVDHLGMILTQSRLQILQDRAAT